MKQKFGLSLPWIYLGGGNSSRDSQLLHHYFSSPGALLIRLKDWGITHIELRHRPRGMSYSAMETVFRRIGEAGMGFSIHGDELPLEDSLDLKSFLPWLPLADRYFPDPAEPAMITLHTYPKGGEKEELRRRTTAFLRRLTSDTEILSRPLHFALENQRKKNEFDPGTTFDGVVSMVQEVDHPRLGICWDMGHGAANHKLEEQNYSLFPPASFSRAAVHTHIHDLGPNGRTHWPLREGIVPLDDFTGRLAQAGYEGIFNLELSFERFAGEQNQIGLIENTIRRLQESVERAYRHP